MSRTLTDLYDWVLVKLNSFPNILVRRLLVFLPTSLSIPGPVNTEVIAGETDLSLATAVEQVWRFFLGAIQIVAVIMLTFFWTLDGGYVKQAAFLLIPVKNRDDIRSLMQEIESKVSGYLLGQGLLCLIIGALAFLAYSLIGLPHAFALALFAGIFEAVPIAGPFIGAVPAILIGLSISPTSALWVVLATIIIQQLENNLLVPRVMKRTIGARPLVTLLALLIFGSLFGILGALIALPLAAIFQLLINRYLIAPGSLEQEDPGRDRLSLLRLETNQLVQDIRSLLRQKESVPSEASDAIEDEVEAIATDIESYLAAQGEKL